MSTPAIWRKARRGQPLKAKRRGAGVLAPNHPTLSAQAEALQSAAFSWPSAPLSAQYLPAALMAERSAGLGGVAAGRHFLQIEFAFQRVQDAVVDFRCRRTNWLCP